MESSMRIQACLTSNSNEWATPQKFYEELDAEFHFNLDPCSTHENAKCERHFTLEDNGLARDWGGQECSATRHTAVKLPRGYASVTRSLASRTPSWLCSFRQGRIRHTSTTLSITRPMRFVSSVVGYILMSQNKGLRSPQWL